MSDKHILELTHAEALVLFEWLARVDEANQVPTEHPAEELVMWRLEAQLESALPEVLMTDYNERVEAARREVHATISFGEIPKR